jgi:hypothetical protein
LQVGHPHPRLRVLTVVCHSCPAGHRYHSRRCELAPIAYGSSSPFMVG